MPRGRPPHPDRPLILARLAAGEEPAAIARSLGIAQKIVNRLAPDHVPALRRQGREEASDAAASWCEEHPDATGRSLALDLRARLHMQPKG